MHLVYKGTIPHFAFWSEPIVFDQPFIYDKLEGNLLLDIQSSGGGHLTYFDDSTAYILGEQVGSGNINGLNSLIAYDKNASTGRLGGVVFAIQFGYEIVPESHWVIPMMLGLGGLILVNRKREGRSQLS